MTCPHCGATVQSNDLFCVNCGQPLRPTDPTRHLDNQMAPVHEVAYGPDAPSYPGDVTPNYPHAGGGFPAYPAYNAETPPYPGSMPAHEAPTPPYASSGAPTYGTPTYGTPSSSTPTYGTPSSSTPTYGTPSSSTPTPVPSYAPPRGDTRTDAGGWASGSSFPAPNPYAGTPNTVSPGTMVNGRPVGNRNGGGLFKGIGAAIAALAVVLAKAGGALAGLGVFFLKFWFWIWAFHFLFRGGLGILILLLIVLMIAGSVWRSQAA